MKIHIEKIGPFENTDLDFNNEKEKYVIYARNGSGKTYLSRCFNLFNCKTQEEIERNIKRISRDENSKSIFNFTKNNKQANFSIEKEKLTITNDTGLLFYVFNSDYTENNLYLRNYQPNGEIDGIITGKENIDLTKEKEQLSCLIAEKNSLKINIEKNIESIKDDIKIAGVTANLKAFKEITFDNVLNTLNVEDDKLNEAKNNLQSIIKTPENLPDIESLDFNFDKNIFTQIKDILKKEYTISAFEEEFSKYVRTNVNFIESGLNLLDGNNKCPFCKRDLDDESYDLIHKYSLFIEDEQTKVAKSIQNFIEEIEEMCFYLVRYRKLINEIYNKIETYSIFIPNIENFDLGKAVTEVDELKKEALLFIQLLDIKNKDISKNCWNNNVNIDAIYNDVESEANNINEFIKKANDSYNNLKSIKTEIRQKVCDEAIKNICINNKENIEKYKQKNIEIESLSKEIAKKEEGRSNKKRDVVAKNISKYLKMIFGDKYIFDENTFEIMLGKQHIGEKAKFILSDGEKNIFAFIHYISSVHTIVNSISEYSNILFIIDDPVSSVDFQHLYEIIYIIKHLDKDLDIDHIRSILFTHNLEFYHSLVRNNTYKNSFVIADNKLVACNKDLIMPYELHLLDIVKAYETKKVIHTIPNSIRNILETICLFEGNGDSFDKITEFIDGDEILGKNGTITVIMNDLSHGNPHYESQYTDEQILGACGALIQYINKVFPNQIENAKKLLDETNNG